MQFPSMAPLPNPGQPASNLTTTPGYGNHPTSTWMPHQPPSNLLQPQFPPQAPHPSTMPSGKMISSFLACCTHLTSTMVDVLKFCFDILGPPYMGQQVAQPYR